VFQLKGAVINAATWHQLAKTTFANCSVEINRSEQRKSVVKPQSSTHDASRRAARTMRYTQLLFA
jgi:hypothetical protein